MKKIKTIVIDDEAIPRKWLSIMLEEKFDEIELLGTANSVENGLSIIASKKPDLVFLDIELGDGNAFDLINQLTEINFKVIFTTSHDKYAINAIRVSALDYLIKPVTIEELQRSLFKFKKQHDNSVNLKVFSSNLREGKSQENKIVLPHNSGYDFIQIKDIVYCQSDVNYTIIKSVSSKEIIVSKPLKEYDELLRGYNFFRIHQSYLINLQHLEKYMRSKSPVVLMSNGDHLNVSKNKREEFVRFLKKV